MYNLKQEIQDRTGATPVGMIFSFGDVIGSFNIGVDRDHLGNITRAMLDSLTRQQDMLFSVDDDGEGHKVTITFYTHMEQPFDYLRKNRTGGKDITDMTWD